MCCHITVHRSRPQGFLPPENPLRTRGVATPRRPMLPWALNRHAPLPARAGTCARVVANASTRFAGGSNSAWRLLARERGGGIELGFVWLRRRPRTRRCGSRGSDLTSSELEGTGLRPDRQRLHPKQPKSIPKNRSPDDPEVDGPTLTRRGRGCGRANPPWVAPEAGQTLPQVPRHPRRSGECGTGARAEARAAFDPHPPK